MASTIENPGLVLNKYIVDGDLLPEVNGDILNFVNNDESGSSDSEDTSDEKATNQRDHSENSNKERNKSSTRLTKSKKIKTRRSDSLLQNKDLLNLVNKVEDGGQAKDNIHTYNLNEFSSSQETFSLQKKFVEFEMWVTRKSISDPELIDARMARVHAFVEYLVSNCTRLQNYVRFEVTPGVNPQNGDPDFVHVRLRVLKKNNAMMILGHDRCREIIATLVPANMSQTSVWPALGKKQPTCPFPDNIERVADLDAACKALAERSSWTMKATQKNGLSSDIAIDLGFPNDDGVGWSKVITDDEGTQILLQIMYNSYYDTAVAALFLLHSLKLQSYTVQQRLIVPNPVLLAVPRPKKKRITQWRKIGDMYRYYFKNPLAIAHLPNPYRSVGGIGGAWAKIESSAFRSDVSYEGRLDGSQEWQTITLQNAKQINRVPGRQTRLANGTTHRGRINTLVAAANAQKNSPAENALLQGLDDAKKKSSLTPQARQNRKKWVSGVGGLRSLMRIYKDTPEHEGTPAPENAKIKEIFQELFARANKEVTGVYNNDIQTSINSLAKEYNENKVVRDYLQAVSNARPVNKKKRNFKSFAGEEQLRDTGFCEEFRDAKAWFDRNSKTSLSTNNAANVQDVKIEKKNQVNDS